MTQDQPNRLDRLEASVATHNEILTSLAPLTAQMAQLLAQQTARGDRHDEVLSQIEEQTRQNSEAIAQLVAATNRNTTAIANLEEQTTRNVESIGRLEQRIDQLAELVTTSTTETIQLVTQQAVQAERDRASWQAEIREIWQYLRYEPRNGNGRGEGG